MQRTQAHQTGDAARRAFERLIPTAWTVQPIHDDYGLDLRVEVFRDGHSTGETFYVQLKGTAQDGRACRVRTAHLDYWAQLADSVLIFSYSTADEAAYARWAHSVQRPDAKQETVTIRFDEDDLWSDASSQRLERDVRFLRQMSRGPRWPLVVAVAGLPGTNERYVLDMTRALTDLVASTDLGGLLRFSSIEPGPPTLELSPDGWRVDLKRWTFTTRDDSDEQAWTPATIVSAIAMLLGAAGQQAEAIRVIRALIIVGHDIVMTPEIAHRLGCHVSAVRNVDDYIKLADWLDAHADGLCCAMFHRSARHDWPLTRTEHRRILSRLRRVANRSRTAGQRAAAEYSLGNHLCSSDLIAAIVHFAAAADADPAMASRPFFNADYGRCLLELGRPEEALPMLRSAARAGHRPAACLLIRHLADEGRFDDALAVSEVSSGQPTAYFDLEADLWSFLLPWAALDPTTANAWQQAENVRELPQAVEAARLLYNAAGSTESKEDKLRTYLLAALLFPVDVEAWACAISLASLSGDLHLWVSITRVASSYVGTEWIEPLRRMTRGPVELVNEIERLSLDILARASWETPYELHLTAEGERGSISLTSTAAHYWQAKPHED